MPSVHRFSADGKHISSFGSPGRGPGQFNVPHSVRISQGGRVYVADRENDRVQIFTAEGEYLDQWTDFERPAGVHIDANQIVYVTDHIPRVSFYNLEGELLARGRIFEHGHNIFSDSRGDFYVRRRERRQDQEVRQAIVARHAALMSTMGLLAQALILAIGALVLLACQAGAAPTPTPTTTPTTVPFTTVQAADFLAVAIGAV